MKNFFLLSFLSLILIFKVLPTWANDYSDDFSSASIKPYWFSGNASFLQIAQAGGALNVTMDNVGKNVNGFGIGAQAAPMNLSQNPRVSITLKSDFPFELSLGLWTQITSTQYKGSDILTKIIPGDGIFHTYYFDYTDHIKNIWPGSSPVDLSKIDEIFFYINLNTVSISGTFQVEEVKIGEDVAALGRGLSENYSTLGTLSGWVGEAGVYTISHTGKMLVETDKVVNNKSTFSKSLSPFILDHNPFIQLSLKSNQAFSIGAQLVDGNGDTTRLQVIDYSPVAENTLITFDFTRALRMPSDTTPNANDIVEIRFIINPDGAAFTGSIEIEKLLVGRNARPLGYEIPLDLPVAFSNMYLPAFAQVEQTMEGLKFTIGPAPGNLYRALNHWIPTWINLKEQPYVTIKVRASQAVTLRLDMADSLGISTNGLPIVKSLTGGPDFETLTYDFTDRLTQSHPGVGIVDPTSIRRILYFPEPGGNAFNGTIEIASVTFGSKAHEPVRPIIVTSRKPIKINQIGYFPGQKKTAVVPATSGSAFEILNESNQVVYQGILSGTKYYSASQENVKVADFTAFDQTGNFRLTIPGLDTSYTFSIEANHLDQVSKDVIKAFYFQRTGIDLVAPYAEGWARDGGHPDTQVLIHPSAATTERPAGTIINSSGGWYDAGDYNKYIVNSSVACYDLLAIYERYGDYFEARDLNIPETGNTLPDILDEVKFNLDWMLSMQDVDGGVYHKLTSPGWNSVFTKPTMDNSSRYVVKKTTTASLDFAAVMAQAYRVYIRFAEYNEFAENCLIASQKAYRWAKSHNNIAYTQSQMNTQYDPDIITGEYAQAYSSSNFADEFFWAATELAIATQETSFINDIQFNNNLLQVMDWPKVYGYALLSLSHYGHLFQDQNIKISAINSLLTLADQLEGSYQSSAYKNSMRIADFLWGSNTYAANEVMLLTEAYNNSQEHKYLDAAIGTMDYILGKNPTGYSYISGAGSNSPVNLYMAVGLSHDNTEQIPGFMAGGPNMETTDPCVYEYNTFALKYIDSDCSYSTNEIAINWNASVSFASNALNAMMTGYSSVTELFEPGTVLSTYKSQTLTGTSIYPNPAESAINVTIPASDAVLQVIGMDGQILNTTTLTSLHNKISLEGLAQGIYILKIHSDKGVWTEKLVVGKNN